MAHRSTPPQSERAAVLTAAVVAHLLIFALLISLGSAGPMPVPRQGNMSLISLAPDAAQGKPPPPVLPSKVVDQKQITPQDSFSAELDNKPRGTAGGCAIFDLVSKSLIADPIVAAAVLSTPRESRSIADAIVIWNTGWSATADSPGEPLGPARAAIEQSLRSVPDSCLDEPVAGPRLVPIPEGERTIFLAIGSGNWTWRQLLVEADPALQAGAIQEQPAARSLWDWL
ncbi:hypothetical protein [Sphingomonas sp.]|uniref:hypothetical protein n=1 Tax=Sphingomonas sp. TaxID=28214 RepID=UPI00286A7515|nr:hypothetical protein [Sphingomonas sp.]